MTRRLSQSLLGRSALITGGAGLLGPQHAIALADLGARIILTDKNEETLESSKAKIVSRVNGARVRTECLDVTSEESISKLLSSLKRDRQEVDILVNNAAIDSKVGGDGLVETSRFENFTLNEWCAHLDVGLTGAFLVSRAFGSEMANRGRGVVLNVSSDLSVIAPDQRLYRIEGRGRERQPVKPVSYSVIKTALIGLTRYLATYWAASGVRVNAISPGGVYKGQSEEFVSRLTDLIPMGRMARSEEYHGAIQFLCSDASAYMTGQNIVIDGGRSVL